ncbi:MAG: SixA phosphatase family protein [Thermoanaerobaculia bacterium]
MLVITLLLALLPVQAADVTTVILVRHAEKTATMEDDAPLHANGAARATELSRVLADVPIDAIYTTQWVRTRDTAAPLAKARGVEPVVVNTSKTYAADLAKTIREKHKGQTVLVVGHSNSTSNVMRELGVENPPQIDESRYDDLFICTISGGKTRMLPLRYGAPVR